MVIGGDFVQGDDAGDTFHLFETAIPFVDIGGFPEVGFELLLAELQCSNCAAHDEKLRNGAPKREKGKGESSHGIAEIGKVESRP